MEKLRPVLLPDPTTQATLSVDEVADILGLDRKTVYAAVRTGELPSLRVGRRILVPTRWLATVVAPDDGDADLTGSRSSLSQQPIQGELPLR